MTHFLSHHFPASSGKLFTDICHSIQNNQGGEETCFTSTFSGKSESESLILSFVAGGREDFVNALAKQGTLVSEDFGPVKYVVENPEQEAITAMKSGKWVAYAARTLVVRFWDLTKVSMFWYGYLWTDLPTLLYFRKRTTWTSCSSSPDMY